MLRALMSVLLLSASLAASPAEASVAAPRVLLSVGRAELGLIPTASPEAECVSLHNVVSWASVSAGGEPYEAECVALPRELASLKASGRYALHIQTVRLLGKRTKLRIENWAPRSDAEFVQAEWIIEGRAGEAETRLQTQKLFARFFGFYHRRAVLDAAVAAVLADEGKPDRGWRRALSEVGAVLGLSGLVYYLSPSAQDVVEPSALKALKSKFTSFDLWRLDDNRLFTNGFSHALFLGPLSYLSARDNGFSATESIFYNAVASAVWEFGVEAREHMSIADQGFTVVGGSVVGEVLHQFELFAARGAPTLSNKVLRNFFGVATWWHRFFGREPVKQAGELDRNGLPADGWHAFDLFLGGESAPDGSGLASAGMRAELFKLPEYGKAGKSSGWRGDTPYSRLDLGAMYGREGLAEVALYAKAALGAYYRQDLTKDQGGALRGYSFMLAPSSGYELRFDTEPGASDDEYGIVNILGPTIDLSIYRAGFRIRAVIDVFADFAQVRSLAWNGVKATWSDPQATKAILWKRDDYYSLGTSHAEKLTLSRGPIEAGAELRMHRFSSIEGWDAGQERVTDDFHLRDRRETRDAWLSYTLPGDRLRLTAGWQQRIREGSIRDTVSRERFSRLYGRLSLLF
ncbi:MAG TPA: DUF3943 domain-containing protein [Bdellovibrionota bacterium]|nr:DUF3943 domain-containing protein [Bdellovibrionota bacterium]